MSKPDFTYAIQIRATREEVWNGLLEPEFTRQYWIHDNISDWQVGSKWEHRRTDGTDKVDIVGRVLENEPHEKLVLSWSRPGELDNPERTSRVEVTLEDLDWPGGPWTALRFEHTELGDDDEMRDGVTSGWPMVFSTLKTVLESGLREGLKLPDDV